MQEGLQQQNSGHLFPLKSEIAPEKTEATKSFTITPESTGARPGHAFEIQHNEISNVAIDADRAKVAASPDSLVATILANAETLYKHSEMKLARELVYKALAIDSENPVALRMASRFLHPETDRAQKIRIHEVLCRVDFGFESLSELAHLYYKDGKDGMALEKYYDALSTVMSETTELFEIYKNVGNILTREGDFAGAEEFYNKAFAVNPHADTLLVNLGTLSMQQDDSERALARFRQAIEINKQNDRAWVGLGLVHQTMGDFNLAMGNLQTALDINPANRTAAHIFVAWSVRDGRSQQAIDCLQDYLSRVEYDEELSIVLIQLYCQMHRLELAQLELERALLWDPKNAQLQAVEGEIAAMLKQAQHRTTKDA